MKGFVTVATGIERYYILAHNLLISYRRHSKSPTPFAILCDQQNEWTRDFDEVVFMDHPAHSYIDKLRILDLSPYDETIFVDADSLVYRDLNELWALFENGPDLGLLGSTRPNNETGWWETQNLGVLKEKVEYKLAAMGGLYYVRNKGRDLPAIKNTCKFIEDHYFDFHFSIFEKILEDETILSLAAAVHHIQPVAHWNDIYAYYPEVRSVSADIRKGRLRYNWNNGSGKPIKKGYFIHFGTLNTISPTSDGIYYRELYRLTYKSNKYLNFKDRLTLLGRRFVNHSRLVHAIAGLFPKELRNKYNHVESRGREHIC